MARNDGISYLVRYENLPQPTADFVQHYETTHAGILKDFPGLRGLTLMTPAAWQDQAAIQPGQADFLAMMQFDSAEALEHALQSEARQRARDDFNKFDLAGATVTHQAMRFRKVI